MVDSLILATIRTQCIEPKEQNHYMHQAHVVVGGFHSSKDQNIQRLKHFTIFWPAMFENVKNFKNSKQQTTHSLWRIVSSG